MKNLIEYRDNVNAWATRKGWNEKPIHVGDSLMLFITELAEAKEDDEAGRMSRYLDDTGKPCGFESEIADVFIRIFHACGQLGIDPDLELSRVLRVSIQDRTLNVYAALTQSYAIEKGWINKPGTVDNLLLQVIMEFARAKEHDRRGVMETIRGGEGVAWTGFPYALFLGVARLLYLAHVLGIDLDQEVQVKMAYNETREKRHGGLRS